MASEPLSSAFGWISLACWVVVYSPQFWENYTLQSGQGLSILFVLIWLAGDVFSLIGGLIAQLVPTAILLAIYYLVCDSLLISQIYYYRWKNPHADKAIAPEIDSSEDTPLLETPVKPADCQAVNEVLKCSLYLAFVVVAGTLAWAIDSTIRGPSIPKEPEGVVEWKSQLLGWVSAILFLGARIPQILKNFETRCDGLSPALFLFTITGNCTFALSICFASMKRRYLLANAPWLAGSLLTVFFDIFVIGQFVYYRSGKQRRIQL